MASQGLRRCVPKGKKPGEQYEEKTGLSNTFPVFHRRASYSATSSGASSSEDSVDITLIADFPIEHRIHAAVQHAHGAAAHALLDLVPPDRLAHAAHGVARAAGRNDAASAAKSGSFLTNWLDTAAHVTR